MSDGEVNVRYEAVADFDAALGRFAQAMLERIKRAETSINRTAEQLEDRRIELRGEMSRLQSAISNADEEEDTSREQSRIEEIEHELSNVRKWQQKVDEAIHKYKREAQRLEELSTGTTAETRAYLRSLLNDLSGYLAFQMDSASGSASGNRASVRVVASGDDNTESSHAISDVKQGDVEAFRSQQGVLALEAKNKEYLKRLQSYQELAFLTLEEYLAINRYSQYDYENMNMALRSDDKANIERWGPQIRLAMNGLKKLPVYEGIVYRGVKGGSWANAYQIGSVVTEKGFASSSWISKGSDGSQLRFEIQSKSGRNISCCSAMQSESAREKEVLFAPRTKFEVTGRIENGATTIIQMREV